MPARKRNFEETLSEHVDPLPTGSSLGRLRSMWQFASLMQYIYFFGEVTKIDKDLDIEVREPEKNIASLRRITDIFAIGNGNGVYETRTIRKARRARPVTAQIRFVLPWFDVSAMKSFSTRMTYMRAVMTTSVNTLDASTLRKHRAGIRSAIQTGH